MRRYLARMARLAAAWLALLAGWGIGDRAWVRHQHRQARRDAARRTPAAGGPELPKRIPGQALTAERCLDDIAAYLAATARQHTQGDQ